MRTTTTIETKPKRRTRVTAFQREFGRLEDLKRAFKRVPNSPGWRSNELRSLQAGLDGR